jgi:hypothetical protein
MSQIWDIVCRATLPDGPIGRCNGFMEQHSVTVGIGPVSFEDIEAVARNGAEVIIADDAWA